MIFHQLFDEESSTYTYLLGDEGTREAILIDPVLEHVDRDLKLVADQKLKLVYVLDTHIHADHVTGAGEIRQRTGARTAVSSNADVDCADLSLIDGQEIRFGSSVLRVLETPGHTDSCLSYFVDGMIFTGDALLIEGTGRTDFQEGSSVRLFESITKKLFGLPDATKVFPAHDYKGRKSSSIASEKLSNPRVGGGRSLEQFVEIMKNLKLDPPKKIDIAVPANRACGQSKAPSQGG